MLPSSGMGWCRGSIKVDVYLSQLASLTSGDVILQALLLGNGEFAISVQHGGDGVACWQRWNDLQLFRKLCIWGTCIYSSINCAERVCRSFRRKTLLSRTIVRAPALVVSRQWCPSNQRVTSVIWRFVKLEHMRLLLTRGQYGDVADACSRVRVGWLVDLRQIANWGRLGYRLHFCGECSNSTPLPPYTCNTLYSPLGPSHDGATN